MVSSVFRCFYCFASKLRQPCIQSHLYYKMTAYRKQHSCKKTLIRLVEDWKTAADRKESVTVLSTDMRPALLIQKLKAYGFSDVSLNLMRSFFELRRNRVKLQDLRSAHRVRPLDLIMEPIPKRSPIICGIRESFYVCRRPSNIYDKRLDQKSCSRTNH